MAKKKSTLIIDGDSRGATKAVDRTTARLGQATGDIQKLGKGLANSLSGFTGLLSNLPFLAATATAGVIFGFGKMIKSSIDVAENLEKMSQRTGTSVEFLSKLRFSAELAGTEISVTEKALQRLSRNMYDANRGLATAKDAFDDAGISITDTNGKLRSIEDVFIDTADKLGKTQDGALKTALALSLYGRAGADLIPIFNQTNRGIKEQFELAKQLGLEISTNTAKQAAKFKDNLTILKYSLTGVANVVSASLLPQLVAMSSGMVSLSKNAQSLVPIINGLITGAKVLGTFLGAIFVGAYAAAQALGTFAATAVKIATFDYKGAAFVAKKGFGDLKEFSLAAGQAFDTLWKSGKNVNNIMEQIKQQAALDEQRASAEKLAAEWEKLSQTLKNDIAKNTLPEILFKIRQIDQKFTEYSSKFPAHIKLIQKWKEEMILASLEIQKSLPKAGDIEPNLRPLFDNIIPGTEDLDRLKSMNDKIIEENSRVTTATLVDYALRQGAAENTFGNMSDAFEKFSNISKNQNKTLFAVHKAFAVAEATINTYKAANVALASAPPPFNFVLAASVIAAGLANVATILSSQPGSTGGGGSAGSAPSAPSGNDIRNNTDNRRTSYVINFYGSTDTTDKDRLARDLIDSINKATEDGLILNVTK